jgi:hypothetical protein
MLRITATRFTDKQEGTGFEPMPSRFRVLKLLFQFACDCFFPCSFTPLLGVPAVEQEDHAKGNRALLLDQGVEAGQLEKWIPSHIPPVLKPAK